MPIRPYAWDLPQCNNCSFHHYGAYWEMHCRNCNTKGQTARFVGLRSNTPLKPLISEQVKHAKIRWNGTFQERLSNIKERGGGGYGKSFSNRTGGSNDGCYWDFRYVSTYITHMHAYFTIAVWRGVSWSTNLIIFLKQKYSTLNEIFTVEMDNGKTETTQDKYVRCNIRQRQPILPDRPNNGFNRNFRRNHQHVLVKASPYRYHGLQKGYSP